MGRANDARREKARRLRADGLGYQEIADRCKVVVSTAWRWTSDIPAQTAAEHDGRKHIGQRRQLPASHRAALSRSMTAVWARQRARHAEVARRLGVSRSTVFRNRAKEAA